MAMLRLSVAVVSLLLTVLLPAVAHSQDLGVPVSTSFLRSVWNVERDRAGRAHVVGYLYNSNIKDAANVWLRVERLTPGGEVSGIYHGRLVGDVLSGDRLLFDVPVPDAAGTYRVLVQSVDWIKECR